ncbi:MAG: thiamine pyrophosphate-dependent dehydrogenase E1 component subunit alpha [Firmicutes bacterium]|nr:thiamine pyrophosphate-dependent dehydrogenase E1 component subunit alpha [Bacillota bacterium]
MDRSIKAQMYLRMLEIRGFETKALELFKQDRIRGSMHLYMGEEAVAVGACIDLRRSDYITSTHRGHGHCVAKGGDLKRMMAELLGRETGFCRGKGGSMHIADMESGILGANGIVGGGIPLAVGAALGLKRQGRDDLVVCFFGDGAINQGSFHEAANLASVWKLPVIFLCENNLYGLSTSVRDATANPNLADRALGYGMPGVTVDGNDVLAVHEAVGEAVRRARAGGGPTLIVAQTYRWEGHFTGDPNLYRTKDEIEEWKKKCPIAAFRGRLLADGFTEAELKEIEDEVTRALDEAVNFGLGSPEPGFEVALEDVYA